MGKQLKFVTYFLQILDAFFLDPSTFQQNTHLFHLSYFPAVYFDLPQTVFFFVNPNGLEMNASLIRALSFLSRLCHSVLCKDLIFDRMILRNSCNGSFSSGLALLYCFLRLFRSFLRSLIFLSLRFSLPVTFFPFFISITFSLRHWKLF